MMKMMADEIRSAAAETKWAGEEIPWDLRENAPEHASHTPAILPRAGGGAEAQNRS